MCGGLEILNNHTESVDRSGETVTLKVIASDFHFLASEMIKSQIELEDRRPRILAVRIALNHSTQALQRLKGQALVAAHIIDLVVIAQGQ